MNGHALRPFEVQIPTSEGKNEGCETANTIVVHVSEEGRAIGDVKLKVQLVSGGVSQ